MTEQEETKSLKETVKELTELKEMCYERISELEKRWCHLEWSIEYANYKFKWFKILHFFELLMIFGFIITNAFKV